MVTVLVFRVDEATGPEGLHVIGVHVDGPGSEWVTHRLKIKQDWLRTISSMLKNLHHLNTRYHGEKNRQICKGHALKFLYLSIWIDGKSIVWDSSCSIH